jgi:hypothetical protein
VPVPGGAVDEDLAVFELARDVEASEGGEKGGDSEEEVNGVNASDEVEEMAALVGLEEDVLAGQLAPRYPLTCEEEYAESDGCRKPGKSAAGDWFAEAKPLVHYVGFAEHVAAGELDGAGAKEEDDGVEPQDGRNGGGEPLVDVMVVGVEVAGGLIDEEGADDGDEEHEVAGEGEEDTHSIAMEALVGAASTVGALVPVVVVATAAGAFVSRWTAACAVVVIFNASFSFLLSFIWSDDCRHEVALWVDALWTAYSGFESVAF